MLKLLLARLDENAKSQREDRHADRKEMIVTMDSNTKAMKAMQEKAEAEKNCVRKIDSKNRCQYKSHAGYPRNGERDHGRHPSKN
jgi:dsDNA-specific endonuclease/ATPase MutS2